MFRKKGFWGLLVFIAAVVVGTFIVVTPRGVKSADASLAVFNVENLSCGSCVKNIQKALANVDGVGKVDVSVTAGRSQVEFDAGRINAQDIAQRITEAGYPAQVREALNALEYQSLREENGRLGRIYVAKVGDRLLPREEFDASIQVRLTALDQDPTPEILQRLRLDVWNDLLQRELLLGAAEVGEVVVQEGEVAQEIERIRGGHAGIDELIAKRFGSQEVFFRTVKNDMIIRRYLEQNIAAANMPSAQRQLVLQQWYEQLVKDTPVVIFDPAIKAATAGGGSGCGGSCCG